MHLYVEEGKLTETTFSIIKAVRKKKGQICAWPVDELFPTLTEQEKAQLEKDVKQMFRTVTDTELDGQIIRREYPMA